MNNHIIMNDDKLSYFNTYGLEDYFIRFPIEMFITVDTNTEIIEYLLKLLYAISSILFLFFGGFYLSMFIYVKLTTNNYLADELDDLDDINDYKNKYMELYLELKENELDKPFLEKLKDIFVQDETPYGKLFMNYDNNYECFTYYTDKKDIPYAYLETVARYYIIKNDCKNIYFHYNDEYNKLNLKKEKENQEKENQEKENQEKENQEKEKQEREKDKDNLKHKVVDNELKKEKKSVFASLKNYKNDKIIKKNNESIYIPEKCNKFIYKGKLLDYESLYYPSTNDDFENIDYNTFKKNL